MKIEETLTAEERAYLYAEPAATSLAGRLIRALDAALARAEAAERAYLTKRKPSKSVAPYVQRVVAAESRLDAATELLERCRDAAQWHQIPQRELCAFLSGSAPAPAEPAANPEEPTCTTCGRLLAVCECGPLAALFGAVPDLPAPAAHPVCHDTSKHQCSFQPAPAAESEPESCPVCKRATNRIAREYAESRIAELEDERRELALHGAAAQQECDEAEARIAQAVAELKRFDLGGNCAARALAILKGTRT